jgi:hypothetical protein
MALKRIKKQDEEDIVGEYHRVSNVRADFETIRIVIYRSESDRQDFKNGAFDNRFGKTEEKAEYRAGLKAKIENGGLAPNATTIGDSIKAYAYESLKEESDYYSSEYFEDC